MRVALRTLAICLALATAAHAQCDGDFDHDGAVTIDELVTAVRNALRGCAAVDGCPLTFRSDTSGHPLCAFTGTYNNLPGQCRGFLLGARFAAGDGLVVIELDTDPPVALGADVVTGSTAQLFAWSDDGFETLQPLGGVARLEDSGRQLRVSPSSVPFSIDGCNFVEYQGIFDVPTAALSGQLGKPDVTAALARLRAYKPTPTKRLMRHASPASARADRY